MTQFEGDTLAEARLVRANGLCRRGVTERLSRRRGGDDAFLPVILPVVLLMVLPMILLIVLNNVRLGPSVGRAQAVPVAKIIDHRSLVQILQVALAAGHPAFQLVQIFLQPHPDGLFLRNARRIATFRLDHLFQMFERSLSTGDVGCGKSK